MLEMNEEEFHNVCEGMSSIRSAVEYITDLLYQDSPGTVEYRLGSITPSTEGVSADIYGISKEVDGHIFLYNSLSLTYHDLHKPEMYLYNNHMDIFRENMGEGFDEMDLLESRIAYLKSNSSEVYLGSEGGIEDML